MQHASMLRILACTLALPGSTSDKTVTVDTSSDFFIALPPFDLFALIKPKSSKRGHTYSIN